MAWVFTGEGEMFFSEAAKKKALVEVSEPQVSYGLDPLELLRRMLHEYGERISALEAWRAEMEGKKEAQTDA